MGQQKKKQQKVVWRPSQALNVLEEVCNASGIAFFKDQAQQLALLGQYFKQVCLLPDKSFLRELLFQTKFTQVLCKAVSHAIKTLDRAGGALVVHGQVVLSIYGLCKCLSNCCNNMMLLTPPLEAARVGSGIKLARHVTEAGLLPVLSHFCASLHTALQQHKQQLQQQQQEVSVEVREACHALSIMTTAALNLWWSIAHVWPGKILFGSAIAPTVLPLCDLAVTALDTWPARRAVIDSGVTSGAASGGNSSRGSMGCLTVATANAVAAAAAASSSGEGSSGEGSSDGPANVQDDDQDVANIAYLLALSVFNEAVQVSNSSTAQAPKEIMGSASLQTLLFFNLAVHTHHIHRQCKGVTPAVSITSMAAAAAVAAEAAAEAAAAAGSSGKASQKRAWQKQQQQRLQQLEVPAFHSQLLESLGFAEVDLSTIELLHPEPVVTARRATIACNAPLYLLLHRRRSSIIIMASGVEAGSSSGDSSSSSNTAEQHSHGPHCCCHHDHDGPQPQPQPQPQHWFAGLEHVVPDEVVLPLLLVLLEVQVLMPEPQVLLACMFLIQKLLEVKESVIVQGAGSKLLPYMLQLQAPVVLSQAAAAAASGEGAGRQDPQGIVESALEMLAINITHLLMYTGFEAHAAAFQQHPPSSSWALEAALRAAVCGVDPPLAEAELANLAGNIVMMCNTADMHVMPEAVGVAAQDVGTTAAAAAAGSDTLDVGGAVQEAATTTTAAPAATAIAAGAQVAARREAAAAAAAVVVEAAALERQLLSMQVFTLMLSVLNCVVSIIGEADTFQQALTISGSVAHFCMLFQCGNEDEGGDKEGTSNTGNTADGGSSSSASAAAAAAEAPGAGPNATAMAAAGSVAEGGNSCSSEGPECECDDPNALTRAVVLTARSLYVTGLSLASADKIPVESGQGLSLLLPLGIGPVLDSCSEHIEWLGEQLPLLLQLQHGGRESSKVAGEAVLLQLQQQQTALVEVVQRAAALCAGTAKNRTGRRSDGVGAAAAAAGKMGSDRDSSSTGGAACCATDHDRGVSVGCEGDTCPKDDQDCQQQQAAVGNESSSCSSNSDEETKHGIPRMLSSVGELLEEAKGVLSTGVAQQLRAFGAAVCAQLPLRTCCNNPACTNTAGHGELELISGKGCSRCKVARYCCQHCQHVHWKEHKSVCKRLAGSK